MTVKQVIIKLNEAIHQLESINTSNYAMRENNQIRINKAYNILYGLKKDLREGK